MKDDSDGDKKQQINHIQNLYGFNLFCQKRFDDSMQVFAKLGTGTASPEHLEPPLVLGCGSPLELVGQIHPYFYFGEYK